MNQKNKININKQILDWATSKMHNGQEINGDEMKIRFNLSTNQVKPIWDELMQYLDKSVLLNCMQSFIKVEMKRNGTVRIQQFAELFNINLNHSKQIIDATRNKYHIHNQYTQNDL